MVTADHLRRIAAWSRELNEQEIEIARAGIVEKSFSANEFICMRGDHFEYWIGVVTGLARIGIVSRGRQGHQLYRPDRRRMVRRGHRAQERGPALRRGGAARHPSAMMDRATFLWLFENSVGFNRFLVRAAERTSRPVHRAARIWPDAGCHRAPGALHRVAVQSHPLSGPDPASGDHQEEIGALSGISRQNANRCLKRLEKEGLLRLEYGGVTIVDLERLRSYGE